MCLELVERVRSVPYGQLKHSGDRVRAATALAKLIAPIRQIDWRYGPSRSKPAARPHYLTFFATAAGGGAYFFSPVLKDWAFLVPPARVKWSAVSISALERQVSRLDTDGPINLDMALVILVTGHLFKALAVPLEAKKVGSVIRYGSLDIVESCI